MTDDAPASCVHCGLAAGAWPQRREVDGEERTFCCYGCFIAWQVARGGNDETVAVGLLIRLGVGAFLAMNIMLFSLALYSGGMDASGTGVRQGVHVLLWVLATPVLVILGGPFFREAAADAARGRLGASALVTVGAGAAYAGSAMETLGGGERVYFDTATMVLALFTLGRYLEALGRAQAMRDLAPMLRPRSMTVRVARDGEWVVSPLGEVREGDQVRALPGERIAVDGVVVEGSGDVDESWLTGESRPRCRGAGDEVWAGTLSVDGAFTVRASTGGLHTRWAGICQALHGALRRPSRIQGVTDRVAAGFAPIVLAIALATFIYWNAVATPEAALMNALAVLVVACPCALGLAVPLPTALALQCLARDGALLRSGEILYRLAGVTHLGVDKTGTLTRGAIRVTGVLSCGATDDEVLRRAAALEADSPHPVARGIVAATRDRCTMAAPAAARHGVPGSGIAGLVEGSVAAIGSARWMARHGLVAPADLAVAAARAEAQGRSAVQLGWKGMVRGVILLEDTVREGVPAAAATLRGMGLDLCVLSGDRPGPVARVARACGIGQWKAGLMPEDKAALLRAWPRRRGAIAMVGDGINDGPALNAADLGIAVGDGADVARETADVVLPGAGFPSLPGLIALARRTRRVVAANLAWALGYNALAIGLAAAGALAPVIAAALMAGSSFIVIASSLRLSRCSARRAGAGSGTKAPVPHAAHRDPTGIVTG